MTVSVDHRRGRRSPWRLAVWVAVTSLVLLVPLVAMQFSDEVDWTFFDFAFLGVLLLGVGVTYELAAGRTRIPAYRAGAGVALAGAFVLIVVNGAVGVIGTEDDKANLMFGAVLVVGIIGAVVARVRPEGMAHAMFATAIAQALVGVIAVAAGWGRSTDPEWPRDILGLTVFFAALWLLSAVLFRKAAQEHLPRAQ